MKHLAVGLLVVVVATGCNAGDDASREVANAAETPAGSANPGPETASSPPAAPVGAISGQGPPPGEVAVEGTSVQGTPTGEIAAEGFPAGQ